MTELLSSGDLTLILADGGVLVVEDAGTGAAVTLRAYRGRRDFDLGGDEAIGLRSVGDTGYALVRKEVTRSGDFFWEETFALTPGGDEAVAARPARLDAFDLTSLEALYGADLNGDGFTGFALLDEIVAPVAGGPSVHQVTSGALAIVDGGDPVAIVSDRGAPWAPGHDQSIVGVRADAGGYMLMLAQRGRGDDISFRELSVSPEGVTGGRSAAVDDVMLLDKEADYGRDFDGDGIVGREVAEETVQLALNAADGLAVFRQPSGLLSVVADPADSDAMVPLVNDAGLPWTPGDNTVYAVRAEGAGVAVLARGEGGDFEYVFAPSGGNLEATGRPLSIDARELALREVAYDLDLNGSGVVGEPVVARRDISVRADGHELELYETEAGSHFFKLGDRVCATRIEGGETTLPPFAPNFPFSEEGDGIVLRASRGQLWDARYDGSNGEAVAIRATAVNGDLRPTAVTVLIRAESETGIVRFYEQDHALDAASNETLAETARWRLTDPRSVEGLYLQDLDLDRLIDARTVDFATDFPISPTGAYLAEERLIVTGEQVRYLSGGPDACGVRAVPADHRFPDYYDAGEELIDRGFRLTPAEQVDERDTLSVSLRSAGGVATFGFTVPDHALQEETHVRVAPATLSPGAIVEIVNSDGVVVSGDDFLESGADLAGGVYFLRVDTSNAEAQPFALELVQRPPLGWVRAVTARENVLEIDQPVIDVDTDLGDVDPDLVTMEFNPGSGGTVVVTAGTELRILAEHAAGKTFIGDGTVALLGDLRGHDFSSVLTATVDFSQADHIDDTDGGAELNFPLDVNLWPPIEAGKLWIIRGDQADLVTRTEGLRIEGSEEGGSVGNARIVDSVADLDLSDVDVAYIDMSGATGTPAELPQVDSGRFVLLRADQATGLGGDFGGARLHLTSESLTHIAENAVDFSAIKLAGGQFTTVVRSDLSVDANADLGELRVTVLGANTTLRLTGEQANARQINDRVAIWTRDTDRSSQQTGAAGRVVVVEADDTTDFSRFGENNISAQNDHLYVTLEFRESGVVDLGANATITSPIGALLRGSGTELPPALRIDAYDVGPGVTLRLGEEQATFREAIGAGRIEIADFGSTTDAWGFQRGSSPTAEATLISGEGVLDLRTNRSLDDAVDEYALGARAASFAEVQATGRLIEGDAGVDVEVYDLQDDTDLSKVQPHLDLTVYQTSDRDISANSNLATVDLFDMSSHALEASSSLLGNDVKFENGNVTLTVIEYEVLQKEFDFTDAYSTVELEMGSDVSGATLRGVDVYSLVDGASVTMSVAQHDVQDVMINGGGSETITLVGSADSDADTDIETYVLDGSHDNVLRLSAGGQSVTGGAGDDTVDVGGLNVSGTYALAGGANVVRLDDGVNISQAEVSAIGGTFTFDLLSDATATMSTNQHIAAAGITGDGPNAITFSNGGTVTGDADIESYTLANVGPNTFTLGANGQSVTGGTGADVVDIGARAITGAIALGDGTDTVKVSDGGNLSGAKIFTGVERVTLDKDANATMTIAQNALIAEAAGTNTVTLSEAGATTGDEDVETYALADGANTFSLGALGQNVTESGGANTLVFGSGSYSGTFTGFGVDDTYQVVNGTNMSGATGLDAGVLDFQDADAAVTLDAAQNGSLTVLANGADAGAQTISVSEADTFTADANVETYQLTGVSQITVAAGTAVSVGGSDSADQTVVVDGLTTTGAYDLGGGTADTVSIIANSDIKGSTFTGVERVTLGSGVNATMTIAQNTLIASAEGINTVTLFNAGVATGDAEVETYVLANGANSFVLGADGQGVTGGTGADVVDVGARAITGAIALGDGNDTVKVSTGANLSGASTFTGVETIDVAAPGATVTISEAQHAAAITVAGSGAQGGDVTIAFNEAVGDGVSTLIGKTSVARYTLTGEHNDFTLGYAGQSVDASAGSGTIRIGAVNASGTLAFTGTADYTLDLTSGANISGVNGGEATTADALAFTGSVSMSTAQHNAFTSGITASTGTDAITLTTDGTATGDADVETYVLANGANTFTLGATGQSVTESGGANTLVFGADTYTGTFTDFDADDTYRVENGTNLSGVTGLTQGTLDFSHATATVTLNAAQNGSLTILASGADAGAQTIIVSEADTFNADANVETYQLTGGSQITVAAGTAVSVDGSDSADQTVVVSGLTTTGAYNLGGGTGDTVSITANSDIRASTFTGVERITLGTDVNATMTIAQNALIAEAAGTNAVTLFDVGEATGDADVETYVLADGANTFTLGALGQSVTESGGDNTLVFGPDAYNGTFTGFGAEDTYRVVNGTNLSGATGLDAGVLDFNDATATVTLDAAQNASLTILADAADAGAQTIALTEAATFTGNAAIEAYILGNGDQTFTVGATGQAVTTGTGTVTVSTDVVTGALDGSSADSFTLAVTAGTLDFTSVSLTGLDAVTVAAGATVTLTAAQAGGLAITGAGKVIVTDVTAVTDLTNATVETLEVQLSGAADLRTNATLGDVDRYDLTGTGFLTLLGTQATGKEIDATSADLGNRAELWLVGLPVDADLSGVDVRNTYVSLTADLAIADSAKIDTVTRFLLSGNELTIGADKLRPDIVQFNEGDSFWSTFHSATGGGSVVVRGVQNGTDLASFIDAAFGTPPITARINDNDTVDLSGNNTLGGVTTYEVGTDATLTVTAAQVDGDMATGFGQMVITGLAGSAADLALIEPPGGVTLALGVADATLAAGFDFADIAYTVTSTGPGTLDIRNADTLPAAASFVLGADVTLTLSTIQANGLTVTGSGDVVVDGVSTLAGVDLASMSNTGDLTLEGTSSGDTVDASSLTRPLKIYGASGNDDLQAGSAADTLAGGEGNDTLRGNAGDDTFIFSGTIGDDTIIGFEGAGIVGGDVIDLSGFAGLRYVDLFIGTVGGDTLIDVGANPSQIITVQGVTGLTADDFLFS